MIDFNEYLDEISEKEQKNEKPKEKHVHLDKHAKRRALDRKIKEEALNQTYLNLSAPIEIENKQLLISLLVKGYNDKMLQYESTVNKTMEDCFKQIIPNQIMKTWNEYPDTCVPFPGFMYKCGKEYGQCKEFFIKMNLPMYLRPDVCQGVFCETWPEKVPLLEKRIALFHYHKDLKTKTEVKYAKSLVAITTYFQLLERKTYWYGLLIDELKKQNKLDLENDLL